MKQQFRIFALNSLKLLGIPTIAVICAPFILASWSDKPSTPQASPIPKPSPLSLPSQLPSPVSKVPPPPTSLLKSPEAKKTPVNTPNSPITNQKASPKPQKAVERPKTALPVSQPVPTPQAPIVTRPVNLDIRVAILRDVPSTIIGASGQVSLSDRNGNILETLKSGESRQITPQGQKLGIGDAQFPPVVWVQAAAGEVIYVGDRWYRGKILLVSQGNSLLVVNYVNLEQYLYSVVGSEMHADAPSEALKAQAIAARSYALVHIIRPASDWYDLGNTQRWQVYKGITSEYNTSQAAVQATTGQILSYQGGVVESLYAATDEIVARAHSGRGMSQTGAYDLARQGMDHPSILSHYYPGVTLARIIVE